MNALDVLPRLYDLGSLMYPEPTLRNWKKRLVLFGTGVGALREFRAWFEGVAGNAPLAAALKRFPLVQGALYWPYIHKDWPRGRRLAAIDGHYRLLDGHAAILAQAVDEDIELLRLDEQHMDLRLVLDKAIWFLREGECVLSIFHGDQRLYSAAFTLGIEGGERVAYLGTLQGSNQENAMEMYRQMTQTLHGLRPRDLMMVALKLFCAAIDVHRIWAISGAARQHNSAYFGDSKKDKVLQDFDEIWREHDGADLGNGFFEIQAVVRYRDVAEIPSKKRASYRRRYQFLDELAARIRHASTSHVSSAAG